MEFFNKKEEVIDLKLTQFGRFLLSKGKFKPIFYSFFDDNILYNSSNAGIVEAQNESEKRIVDTPTTHPQISFSSLEKEFNNNYNKVVLGGQAEDLQRTPEKHYALPQPMGTSEFNSEYSPSWTVQFLNGALSGSINHLNLTEKAGGANTQIVPQITSELKIKVLDISENGTPLDVDGLQPEEFEGGFAESNVAILSDDDDLSVLLKISENNGLFQRKNFDIEIFEIQEEEQNGTIIETLRSLSFSSAPEVTSDVSFVDNIIPDEDTTYADYYFDILVDDEISDEILCKFDPADESLGSTFSDPRTKLCQDIINQQKKKVFDIYEDGSDVPGDIC
jgi:hypothetical protein